LRTMMFVLMGVFFLGVSSGYATIAYTPLESIPDKNGTNTYKNNFLGIQITTPAIITTRIPVSSFERAPGDRMFFKSDGNMRIINVILHYEKFDIKSYMHHIFLGDRYMESSYYESSYEQIKDESGREFSRERSQSEPHKNLSSQNGRSNSFALKVDLETREIGENKFFYYAILDKNSGKREYYFVYPLGDDYIEFTFFNQSEDLILNVMKSVKFFKGVHEDPGYPYWPN